MIEDIKHETENVQQPEGWAGQVINHTASEALTDDIGKQTAALEKKDTQRRQDIVNIVLSQMAARCDDLSSSILEAKAEKKACRKALLNIVSTEIVAKSEGNIRVFNYSERASSEQTVYLYQGTCWVLLEQQRYYDFVQDCATKCGLAEELNDPAFKTDLCHWVASQVARSRPTAYTKDVLINLDNGTLVVKPDGTATLRPHSREDYLFYVLSYAYDATAECQRFQTFLDQVLPDRLTQQTVAEYIAYLFTNSAHPEKMMTLYGPGSNGKSVLLSVVESLVGSENTSFVNLERLTTDDEARVQIENKLLNISYEAGRDIDASYLKLLVSREPVTVRELYKGTRTIRDYAKLITSFNQLPQAEATSAFFRRLIIVTFSVVITEDKADTDLVNKLRKELPGILNWVLRALPGFLQRGTFFISEECQKALNSYKLNSDNVRLFADEWCETDQTPIKGQLVFDTYKSFCHRNELRPLGRNRFFDRMEALGFERVTMNKMTYFKLRLMSDGNS